MKSFHQTPTSTVNETGKALVTVRNVDISKRGTLQEKQTPLMVYADPWRPSTCEKLVDEQIHSQVKQFTRNRKGDKKRKHRRRELGSGVSSSRSNISRAIQRRTLKIPIFLAIPSQCNDEQADLHSKLVLPRQSTSSSFLQHVVPAPCNPTQMRLWLKSP